MRTEMDQYLASIYDTEDTIEKMAQYESLYKQAEQEGIDLDGLSQEQLDELAAVQLSAINDQVQEEVPTQDTTIKQAEANLELADYMGRIMAHAYYQEMGMIEKNAFDLAGAGKKIRSAGETAALHGMYAGDAIKKHVGGAASAVGKGAKRFTNLLAGGGEAGMRPGNHAGSIIGGKGYLAGEVSEARKSLGARAGLGAGAAAVGGGAYAAHKKLANDQLQAQQAQTQGNAGAFEQLKIQRAAQILQEQGFDTSLLAQFVEQQDMVAQQETEQQAQQQQIRTQQQQQHVQQMQQPRTQNVAPQTMQQTGQQGQQFQQTLTDPQAQQAEAIKMANDMMQQQFNQALDEAAWNLLAQSGYPIEEGQETQQVPMGQLPGQVVQ